MRSAVYVHCPHCGCRQKAKEICKICKRSMQSDPNTTTPPKPFFTTEVAPATESQTRELKPLPTDAAKRRGRRPPQTVATVSYALPPLPATPPALSGAKPQSSFIVALSRWMGKPADVVEEPVVQLRPLDVTDGRGFNLSIVGESHYQLTLRRIGDGRSSPNAEILFRAWLVPDPQSPYDPNAVAVMTDDGKRVGHLDRDFAREYQPPLLELGRQGYAPHCVAKLIGGYGHKKHFGVMLDVRDPREGLLSAF